MKKDLVLMSLLFDFYAGLLTDKQRDMFALYYNEDLSLGEIAESEGITRQGVRDAIQRAEAVLRDAEEKLGLIARFAGRQDALRRIAKLAHDIQRENGKRIKNGFIEEKAGELIEQTRTLLDG